MSHAAEEYRTLFHDIFNRLASMKSAAELSLLGGQLSPEDTKNLESIAADIDRLTKLVNELRTRAQDG